MMEISHSTTTPVGQNVSTSAPLPDAYPNDTHTIVIATLFVTVGIIGMTGNLLVLVAVVLSSKLQTATNAFVVNLSISDFLTCFVLPFHAVGVLSTDGWPLADLMCNFVATLTITTPIVSVLTLAMIAVNRYTLITKTKKTYQQIYQSVVIAALVACTWLLPILTLVVPQLTTVGDLGYDPFYKICKWKLDLSNLPIFQTISSLIFLASTMVIMFCYVSIYVHVRKHIQTMKAKRQSHVISLQSISIEEAKSPSPVPGRQRSPTTTPATNGVPTGAPTLRQVKITKNLCYVVIAFFICVVPYSVLLICQVRHLVVAYLVVLFVLSSNINPILYAAKHPDFRTVFCCMLHCTCTDIPNPSDCMRGIIQRTRTTSTSSNKNSMEC